jgi:hypothetical protein
MIPSRDQFPSRHPLASAMLVSKRATISDVALIHRAGYCPTHRAYNSTRPSRRRRLTDHVSCVSRPDEAGNIAGASAERADCRQVLLEPAMMFLDTGPVDVLFCRHCVRMIVLALVSPGPQWRPPGRRVPSKPRARVKAKFFWTQKSRSAAVRSRPTRLSAQNTHSVRGWM